MSFSFLTHAVPDQGSGISETTAGNSAAEENPGGEESGVPPHSPQLPWRSEPPVLGLEKSHPSDRADFGSGVPKKEGRAGTGWEMVVGSNRTRVARN